MINDAVKNGYSTPAPVRDKAPVALPFAAATAPSASTANASKAVPENTETQTVQPDAKASRFEERREKQRARLAERAS